MNFDATGNQHKRIDPLQFMSMERRTFDICFFEKTALNRTFRKLSHNIYEFVVVSSVDEKPDFS